MDFLQMIKTTGHLPSKAILEDGTELELFVRQLTGNKGYRATIYTIVDGLPRVILFSAIGATRTNAEDNLKDDILKNEMLKH